MSSKWQKTLLKTGRNLWTVTVQKSKYQWAKISPRVLSFVSWEKCQRTPQEAHSLPPDAQMRVGRSGASASPGHCDENVHISVGKTGLHLGTPLSWPHSSHPISKWVKDLNSVTRKKKQEWWPQCSGEKVLAYSFLRQWQRKPQGGVNTLPRLPPVGNGKSRQRCQPQTSKRTAGEKFQE